MVAFVRLKRGTRNDGRYQGFSKWFCNCIFFLFIISFLILSCWISSRLNQIDTDTVDDIVFPEICPLMGFKILIEEFGIRHDSPSIDRKDPKKGYTKENIWIISTRANILKNNASLEELELLVKNLKLCGFT